MSLITTTKFYLKNIRGFSTTRKIVVFLVDDYGSVRLASREARDKISGAGIKLKSRFDLYDAIETREDLEILFNTLTSVKDKNNRNAVISAVSVPGNIDFEGVLKDPTEGYRIETLPDTYKKLETHQPDAYRGTWELWKEGISSRIFIPEFHGREHLNLKVFDEKLKAADPALLIPLRNRSLIGIADTGYSTIHFNASFDFWDFKESLDFPGIITDGLSRFEEVFGRRALHFTAPRASDHHCLYKTLKGNKIRFIDAPLIKREHQGFGRYTKTLSFTGQQTAEGLFKIVRNVVFEPGERSGIDWSEYALMQIEAAFTMKKPVILSSHRVNFSGHIDQKNREIGITALKELLGKLVNRYPEAEFMSIAELGELIESKYSN